MKIMRKIINDPAHFVDEAIEGILLAHGHRLRPASANNRGIVRSHAPEQGKVGIVTGGGFGHLPIFLGYVGDGLCSGVAVGNVFSSPPAELIAEVTRASHGGAGVLYLYGNYGGDVLNFDMAAELCLADDIETQTVLVTDDVASAPAERWTDRRGVAGMVFAYKIAGAAASRGDSLADVARRAEKANSHTRSMGVGLSPTVLPAAGEPTFALGEGEMEIGIGIHGEPGVHRGALETADSITDRLLAKILPELDLKKDPRVAVMVNGMGATPLEELYIMYRHIHAELDAAGTCVYRSYVGNYATSLEMAGASVTVCALDDDLVELLDAPAASPFFTQDGVHR